MLLSVTTTTAAAEPPRSGLLNLAQAAEYLNVPYSWLRDKVTAGAVPHTRLGRHVRFAPHHLEAIIEAGEKNEPVKLIPSGRPRRSGPGRPRPAA